MILREDLRSGEAIGNEIINYETLLRLFYRYLTLYGCAIAIIIIIYHHSQN